MQTEPDDDHAEEAEDQDKGGDHDDARPAPRYVRCPMLACGRLHELPPDWE
ncbi:hypothetical protein [Streptomyces koyangensis]|uniref:Uncharacterized protein n=1 Tax=Streptomyces koyangensis TaxID=188770 RepID=A0ABX7EG78_9ACTN|nr:hypothetical protein [Streptomyces koyangensis]QRF03797.1 hypothetical protein G9U55_17485 [Streptomyces koyangensis]